MSPEELIADAERRAHEKLESLGAKIARHGKHADEIAADSGTTESTARKILFERDIALSGKAVPFTVLAGQSKAEAIAEFCAENAHDAQGDFVEECKSYLSENLKFDDEVEQQIAFYLYYCYRYFFELNPKPQQCENLLRFVVLRSLRHARLETPTRCCTGGGRRKLLNTRPQRTKTEIETRWSAARGRTRRPPAPARQVHRTWS